MTTAKTHLENIVQKSGVKRQAELMRLAARAASTDSAAQAQRLLLNSLRPKRMVLQPNTAPPLVTPTKPDVGRPQSAG